MKKKLIVLSGMVMSFAPFVALAAPVSIGKEPGSCTAAQGTGTIEALLCKILSLINAVLPVLIALGVLFFVWGVITFVIGNDEEAKTKGRNRMIYGIIGLAVIIGMWGLVNILTKTFDLNNVGGTITVPTVNY